MGFILALLARYGPRIGNLQSSSYCTHYSKFACSWQGINRQHNVSYNGDSGLRINCRPLSSASHSLLFSQRTVTSCRLLSDLRCHTNSFSSHTSRHLNLSDSIYYLGSIQSDHATCPVTDCLGLQGQQRRIHTSPCGRREESKVEETLEALKESMKQSSTVGTAAKSTAEDVGAAAKTVVPAAVTAPVKKPLRERIVAELKHYYHGFRLLYIDVKVCARLIWQLLNGRPLMRREQKQLVRTTADLFRLVPFLVIIIIPFAEFALPVLLKFFPEMLPSTFKEENKELEKRRKRLKLKLEMAKFLQDTIEETALQRKGGSGESVQEFVKFIEKIRSSGVQATNEEILKFSKLFEDEITLDNLSYDQLRALCRLLVVPTVGTSYFLRFQIEMKLRHLEADDKLIQKEGVDSMAIWELQDACRQRGMRSFGVSEQRLRSQLNQWLDLHLKQQVPTSLLLLSRALYMPEHLSPEDQLRATLSALPAETMAEEAKVKMLEVTGDRVDNKSKLEVIRQEEEIIQREKAELEKAELAEKLEKAKAAAEAPAGAVPSKEVLEDAAPVLDMKGHAERLAEIDSGDLERIEDLLDHVIESRKELKKEEEELLALKEDITEYRESLEDVQEVVQSSGGAIPGLTESKAAQRLSRKVQSMIGQMDAIVKELTVQKKSLIDDIKAEKGSVDASKTGDGSLDVSGNQSLEQISQKQNNLITINELLVAIDKLQQVSDSSKFEMIARVLDEDKDGVIDYNEALKVIELLGKENIKLSAAQMTEIMSVLRKEKTVLEAEKQQKIEERKLQQQQQTAASAVGDETAAAEKKVGKN